MSAVALPIRGLLSVVGSEVHYTRLERKVKPKVVKIKPSSLPNRHRPHSAGELSVVKIWQLYGLGKLGGIWQLYGLGKMGKIWQLCGCRWLAMAVIIRRGVTDNRSPGEPAMALIIRRDMAPLALHSRYYQTLLSRQRVRLVESRCQRRMSRCGLPTWYRPHSAGRVIGRCVFLGM